ncbi:MAG: serine hydrolase domain-containing protein [Chthoniobacterales bacterium]
MGVSSANLAERLQPLFAENFERFGELGAAVSVWREGRSVLELHGGFCAARREIPWREDTLVLFWSATKGLASASVLHLLQERGLGLERRVAEFWPEFAENGKEAITLAQLLSHQAGLAALDEPVAVTEHAAVAEALARQRPLWPPGEGHGYHARTFGFLLDELVRRIDGRTLGVYWREVFAEPLALDLWIGLPTEENARTADIYAARAGGRPEPAAFYKALATPGTLVRQVFGSPRGLQSISAMNAPENRALSLASLGGIGSARALAKFYALLAEGGALDGRRFFSASTIAQMTTTLTAGLDRVFGIPTAFSAGFMKDAPGGGRRLFGPSPLAFGHPGAGGSHAFADPENRLAFAYVMNQMEPSVLPNEKSLRLVDALYRGHN